MGDGLGSHIPAIGASGAVSGVLGAYQVLHPRSHTLWFMLAPWDVLAMRAGAAPRPLILLPAAIALGFWVVLQVIGAWSCTSADEG